DPEQATVRSTWAHPSAGCPTHRSISRLSVFSAIPWRSHFSHRAAATSHNFELPRLFFLPPHTPLLGCHTRLKTQETPARSFETAGLHPPSVRFAARRNQERSAQILADAALHPLSLSSRRTSPAPRPCHRPSR